jgi:hypothetical protein
LVALGVLPAVIYRLLLTSAGRDGLTHNMLENIHSHWKRKRVCKIKCKGVCTIDMDNICHQLEVVSSFLLPFGSVVCVSPAVGIMISIHKSNVIPSDGYIGSSSRCLLGLGQQL